MTLWEATSRHREQLLSLASVATSQQTWMAGRRAHSLVRGGKISRPPSFFFFFSSPTSPVLLSCEFQHAIYTSTLRNPYAQRSRMLAFYYYYYYFKTPLPVQKVTTIYSIHIVFCFDLNRSDAQLPLFPSLQPSFDHSRDAGEALVVAAEPLFVCLFLYLALNLMTAVSGSQTESWCRCNWPLR